MRRDTAIGIGLLVFCAVLYWQAGLVPVPPFIPIGPSFYPRVMLIFLAGLAVWLIGEDLFKKRSSAGEAKKAKGPAPNYRRVLWGFSIFLGYVACLDLIGFVTSTFLFILGLSWAVGPRNAREVPKLVAVAAGTALACYLL
ncbi:MAG TPA: tripartite tricarboxylate transporter TctB family protein, partial [Thermodesulfobacteriota bacterium]|nr:tripartite tricarboxylate transporter TctB family protein [Thermodesulfobacteriota bacterium]